MDLQQVSRLIGRRWVHQIRAGDTHRFVDISIVEAHGRFFVRQYNFGERSCIDAFLVDSKEAIKCGDTIVSIDGVVPLDLEQINPAVTRAYYGLMGLGYDKGQHEASTLELIPRLESSSFI